MHSVLLQSKPDRQHRSVVPWRSYVCACVLSSQTYPNSPGRQVRVLNQPMLVCAVHASNTHWLVHCAPYLLGLPAACAAHPAATTAPSAVVGRMPASRLVVSRGCCCAAIGSCTTVSPSLLLSRLPLVSVSGVTSHPEGGVCIMLWLAGLLLRLLLRALLGWSPAHTQ